MSEDKVLCRICGKSQVTKYAITDLAGIQDDWFHCFCGTVFRDAVINKNLFNAEYLAKWADKKGFDLRSEYLLRLYIPLIEEIIYGRKFLDVGFGVPYNILNLKDRGWIATGVDLIPNDFIQDDFEVFEFGDKFNFILMGHVLESFRDPVGALKRAYNLLDRDGVLLITHPAPELIHYLGLSGFGHWDNTFSTTFISDKELKRLALGIGFEVVLSRINFSQRFLSWNNRHMILQRKY